MHNNNPEFFVLRVTQEDINEAENNRSLTRSENCPVTLAAKRAIGASSSSCGYVWLQVNGLEYSYRCGDKKSVFQFQQAFDREEKVAPFEITMYRDH